MLNVGLRCSCNKIFPILAEDLPRLGFYVCVNCRQTFVISLETEDELSDT
jgi:hypothetical protein